MTCNKASQTQCEHPKNPFPFSLPFNFLGNPKEKKKKKKKEEPFEKKKE
jgi:hypothetical protein